MSFTVKIYSRYHVVFEGEAEFAAIPTKNGEVGILENHIRLYSKLDDGIIRLKIGRKTEEFTCTGGILEVLPKEVRILVDSSENVEEIDETRAAEAVQKAQAAVKEARESRNASEFTRASYLLRKSRLRLSAAKRRAGTDIGITGKDIRK